MQDHSKRIKKTVTTLGIIVLDQDGQVGTPDWEEWGNVTLWTNRKWNCLLFSCVLLLLTSTLLYA